MQAKNNLEKTTNSLGRETNCDLISPKDNEKQIVAIIKFSILIIYNKQQLECLYYNQEYEEHI